MSLQSLRLLPRGVNGWSSPVLHFGEHTTLLLGDNGAGKTPLIKALAYALGYPVELPPLIKQMCRAVQLVMQVDDITYTVERQIAAGLDVSILDSTAELIGFTDERTFSEWMLPKLGMTRRPLVSPRGDKVPPYISIVGPMFLVDQDHGWSRLYAPFDTHQFVKDQREEVTRWVLEIPPRNRAIDKSEYEAAKLLAGSIQEQIAFKRKGLETLLRELGEDRATGTAQRLEAKSIELESSLNRAQTVLEGMSQTESILDVRIRTAMHSRDEIAYRLANAKRRKQQLNEVQAEVGVELGALEQNEVAADAFVNGHRDP